MNFRFWHWITICGSVDKRELYEEALKKKEEELDLRQMVKAWRTVNFIGDI